MHSLIKRIYKLTLTTNTPNNWNINECLKFCIIKSLLKEQQDCLICLRRNF